MRIAILNPKAEFSTEQQKRLSSLGEVDYLQTREELSLDKLLEFVKGAEILGVDPDPLGGFEKASVVLIKIVESLPTLKGIALDTTDTSWIDLAYCSNRGIVVTNLPKSNQRETIAEYTIALLLCLAKRIIELDRQTQDGKFLLKKGIILKGKTLGIIGLGTIGARVAEIANGLGMSVIAYNHTLKQQTYVKMKSFEELLQESDAISIHIPYSEENKEIIGEEEINRMKDGVLIVNTADRGLVNEQAMAKALKTNKVFGYAYEGEDLKSTPLAAITTAIGLKPFGWYTKEALDDLFETWVKNIEGLVINKPQNVV